MARLLVRTSVVEWRVVMTPGQLLMPDALVQALQRDTGERAKAVLEADLRTDADAQLLVANIRPQHVQSIVMCRIALACLGKDLSDALRLAEEVQDEPARQSRGRQHH